jgi:hypothetical protein
MERPPVTDFPVIPTTPDFDMPDVGTGASEKRYRGEPLAGATDRPRYAQNGTWLNRDVEAAAAPSFVTAGSPPPNPLEAGAVRAQIDEAPALATAVTDAPPSVAPAEVGQVITAISGVFGDSFDPSHVPVLLAGPDATPTEGA